MQWIVLALLLAEPHAAAHLEPSYAQLPHANPPLDTADLGPLPPAFPPGEPHAALRSAIYQLGYANAVRTQLEYHLAHWESQGEARAFLLPHVDTLDDFNLAHVQERYDIPLEMHPLVVHYVRFFQGPGRKWFARWLGRSTRYVPLMRPILEKAQLPRDTVYLAMIESGFSPHAYSWAHAAGPWQFIPSTGAHYGLKQNFWVDERRDPVKSTEAAARYLTDIYRQFGNWHLAWAGYNAGENRVRRLMERHPLAADFWALSEVSNLATETKHYVPKLIAAALIAKHPHAFGFHTDEIAYLPPLEFDEALLELPTDLALVARLLQVPLETLQEFNPELLHAYTPPASPAQPYALRIPKGSLEAFVQAYAPLSPQEKASARPFLVRKGDSLGKIAAQAKLPAHMLADFNQLSLHAPLRAGHTVWIPRADALNHANNARPRPHGQPLVYLVRSGDSLWSISRKFNVEVKNLQSWNRAQLAKNKTLRPGNRLTVWPRGKHSAASVVAK